MKRNIRSILLKGCSLLVLLTFASNTDAQITIGSVAKPTEGALLQLKENEEVSANSNRGLLLPKVKLTSKNNLFPMFETAPGSGVAADNYKNSDKEAEDMKHTGLIVYSSDNCDGIITQGVHIWNGKEWMPLTHSEAMGKPQILVNEQGNDQNSEIMLYLPSGKDYRPFISNQSLNIGWKTLNLTAQKNTVANTVINGTFFSSNSPESWPSTLTTNPTAFNFSINDMSTLPGIDFANPFQSRETRIEFTTSTDDCGTSAHRTVILNQTNFALQSPVNEIIKITDYNFTIKDPFDGWDSFEIPVKSNAIWETTYTEVTPNIIEPIVTSNIGKIEHLDNQPFDPIYVRPTRHANIASAGKYKIAGTLKIEDEIPAPNNRFDPITVTIVRCQGNIDMSGTVDGDVTSEALWGDNAVKHTDQDGNIFYSAKFGNARWMTTNLAAKTYDSGEVNNPLYLHDSSAGVRRSYAYPRLLPDDRDGEIENDGWDVTSTWKLQQGLLYTWYAASNITNPSTSIDRSQATPGVDGTPGSNEVEMTGNKGTAPNAYIQGICPNGWHLPSDREWNRLEKELYNNPKKYSNYTDAHIARFSPLQWDESYETATDFRGSNVHNGEYGHGGVLNEMCSVDDISYHWMRSSKGYSKEPALGGFNLVHPGTIRGSRIEGYAYDGKLWTSSTSPSGFAWSRFSNFESGAISRLSLEQHLLFSVRCVKN